MKTNPNKLWILVFALGWLFDFLFWKMKPGINFAIFATACLISCLLSFVERWASPEPHQPDPASAIWLFRRCHIYPRRADDHVPCLHIHIVDDDPARSDLSRWALDPVYSCGLPGQVPAIGWQHDRASNYFYDQRFAKNKQRRAFNPPSGISGLWCAAL